MENVKLKLSNIVNSNLIVSALLFGITLGIYIMTLCPTVWLSDCGELASVCYTMGIAHPTGYPLYTLLGKIFTIFISPPVLATNFMSAFFSAVAVIFLFLTLLQLDFPKLISAISALLLPLGKIMWDCSVSTEVYSLSSAIIWASIFFLFCWKNTAKPKYLILFAYIYGLSFANHIGAILWLPAIIFIIASNLRKLNFKVILSSALSFLLAWTIYIYLPVRSVQSPLLNWGAPHTLTRFFCHLTAWQYRVWMFSRPISEIWNSIGDMFQIILANLGWIIIIPALGFIGLFFTPRNNSHNSYSGDNKRKLTLIGLVLSIFIFDAFYSLNYVIPDIEPYYLPIAGIMAICSAGIWNIFRKPRWLSPVILTISAIIALIYNFSRCDQSDNYSGREYAENVLNIPLPNSLLVLGSWDMYAPAFYLQICQGIRTDLKLVDFSLLRRSWYVQSLIADKLIDNETGENFLHHLKPFEAGKKYNSLALQSAFEKMIDSMISKYNKPVYAFVMEDFFRKKYTGIPEGLLLRIDEDARYRTLSVYLWEVENTLRRKNLWKKREKTIYRGYEKFLLLRAGYTHDIGKFAECEEYLQLAHKFTPDNVEIMQNILVVQIKQNDFNGALRTVDILEPYLKPGEANILRQDIIRRMKLHSHNMKE